MTEICELNCCGIQEIDGLRQTPKRTLLDVADYRYGQEETGAFYVFADVVKSRRGKNLSKYILKHELGTITPNRALKNPNSGSRLNVWVWGVNKRNFKKWYRGLVPYVRPRRLRRARLGGNDYNFLDI